MIESTPENMQRVISAGIIIFRRTKEGIKFLILYHGRNYWNFPKGKLEAQEKSWQAAVREVFEETGLQQNELRFVRGFRTQERFVYNQGKQKIFKIVILYLAETRQSRVTIATNEHHEGYGWFTVSEAKRIMGRYPESLKILTRANEFLHKQGIRGRSRDPARRNTHVPRSGAPRRSPPSVSGSGQHPEQK